MTQSARPARILALTLVLGLALPAVTEAGSPLICRFFDTATASLPWGSDWSTPDRRYDFQRVTRDTLDLLTPALPVLARMETLRRATLYSRRDPRLAGALTAALVARAHTSSTDALAIFDAGYFIESLKQASHMDRGAHPAEDGYAMVRRAIALAGAHAEMEFAASLMTSGAASEAHRRRALEAASRDSLVARYLGR